MRLQALKKVQDPSNRALDLRDLALVILSFSDSSAKASRAEYAFAVGLAHSRASMVWARAVLYTATPTSSPMTPMMLARPQREN
jgi:hypothetical protein